MKMATAMYLEHYLDSIENLPCELQRNFQLMRELDQRTEDKKAEIDMLAAEYISTVKALSPGQRVEQLRKIQDAYSRCREYSDDKVQLAMQTYEMKVEVIRKKEAHGVVAGGPQKKTPPRKRSIKEGACCLCPCLAPRGSVSPSRCCSLLLFPHRSEFSDTILSVHPSDVLDMPVDPNEPTYCLCHQVSYGEMIGCDNPDCPIEWFHFACVDLTTKPKGKWSVWGVGLFRPVGIVCTGSP
ncbi:hypothetical protein MC885_012367 [Smutsia gigantea]|nr:hypothetical protein MC885_012367 [Smutsia gigantea]